MIPSQTPRFCIVSFELQQNSIDFSSHTDQRITNLDTLLHYILPSNAIRILAIGYECVMHDRIRITVQNRMHLPRILRRRCWVRSNSF